MSLDIVEFIIAVEDAFEVQIPNEVAVTLATPGMVANFIFSQLPQTQHTSCLSQRAFYRLRRGMMDKWDIPKANLRPETRLRDVLPQTDAVARWRSLGQEFNSTHWPRLQSGRWFTRIFRWERADTLGDAARHLAFYSPRFVKHETEAWSLEEVENVIVGLMKKMFALELCPLDGRFVDDFGLD